MKSSKASGKVRPHRPDSPPGATSPITLGFVLTVLRQWGKVVIPVGILLGSIAATVVYVTFTPLYQAKYLFWMDDQSPYLVRPVDNDRNFVNNQIGLIRNSLVLSPVVSRPEVASLPELTAAVEPVEVLRAKVLNSANVTCEFFTERPWLFR